MLLSYDNYTIRNAKSNEWDYVLKILAHVAPILSNVILLDVRYHISHDL